MTPTEFEAAHARARRMHPGLDLGADVFRAHLEAREAGAPLARLHVEDLYLACACAAGDAKAIARLEALYLGSMPVAVARLPLSPAEADEVRQRLRERVFVADGEHPPRIADYGGLGPLSHWLKAVATRLAIDSFRAKGRELPADDETFAALASPEDSPEVDYLKDRYAPAFRAALRESFRTLDPQRRTELKLYYLDGLTLEELGALYKVVPSTIARRLARTREDILTETRKRLRAELGLGPEELESILGVIASRIELSRGAFGPG